MSTKSSLNKVARIAELAAAIISFIASLIGIYQFAGIESCPDTVKNFGSATLYLIGNIYLVIIVGIFAHKMFRHGHRRYFLEVERAIACIQVIASIPGCFLILYATPWNYIFYSIESEFLFFTDSLMSRTSSFVIAYIAVMFFCTLTSKLIYEGIELE